MSFSGYLEARELLQTGPQQTRVSSLAGCSWAQSELSCFQEEKSRFWSQAAARLPSGCLDHLSQAPRNRTKVRVNLNIPSRSLRHHRLTPDRL